MTWGHRQCSGRCGSPMHLRIGVTACLRPPACSRTIRSGPLHSAPSAAVLTIQATWLHRGAGNHKITNTKQLEYSLNYAACTSTPANNYVSQPMSTLHHKGLVRAGQLMEEPGSRRGKALRGGVVVARCQLQPRGAPRLHQTWGPGLVNMMGSGAVSRRQLQPCGTPRLH